MKAIHNSFFLCTVVTVVVLYPKDTEKWKQFTTKYLTKSGKKLLFCIPKILKNESNSQLIVDFFKFNRSCFVSQRYWKMKAIHNILYWFRGKKVVVLYPKDTEKWKQFTTWLSSTSSKGALFCIPKILKNESNSQLIVDFFKFNRSCFVSQRYWKMKAIHNNETEIPLKAIVVLYPKDTEKWKQFTT